MVLQYADGQRENRKLLGVQLTRWSLLSPSLWFLHLSSDTEMWRTTEVNWGCWDTHTHTHTHISCGPHDELPLITSPRSAYVSNHYNTAHSWVHTCPVTHTKSELMWCSYSFMLQSHNTESFTDSWSKLIKTGCSARVQWEVTFWLLGNTTMSDFSMATRQTNLATWIMILFDTSIDWQLLNKQLKCELLLKNMITNMPPDEERKGWTIWFN